MAKSWRHRYQQMQGLRMKTALSICPSTSCFPVQLVMKETSCNPVPTMAKSPCQQLSKCHQEAPGFFVSLRIYFARPDDPTSSFFRHHELSRSNQRELLLSDIRGTQPKITCSAFMRKRDKDKVCISYEMHHTITYIHELLENCRSRY